MTDRDPRKRSLIEAGYSILCGKAISGRCQDGNSSNWSPYARAAAHCRSSAETNICPDHSAAAATWIESEDRFELFDDGWISRQGGLDRGADASPKSFGDEGDLYGNSNA